MTFQFQPGSNGNDLASNLSQLKVNNLERTESQISSNGGLSPSITSPGTSRSYRGTVRTEPFIIGVAGGTASGKTTVCDQIVQRLHGASFFYFSPPASSLNFLNFINTATHLLSLYSPWTADQCVVMLAQDSFYRGLTPEEKADVASESSIVLSLDIWHISY